MKEMLLPIHSTSTGNQRPWSMASVTFGLCLILLANLIVSCNTSQTKLLFFDYFLYSLWVLNHGCLFTSGDSGHNFPLTSGKKSPSWFWSCVHLLLWFSNARVAICELASLWHFTSFIGCWQAIYSTLWPARRSPSTCWLDFFTRSPLRVSSSATSDWPPTGLSNPLSSGVCITQLRRVHRNISFPLGEYVSLNVIGDSKSISGKQIVFMTWVFKTVWYSIPKVLILVGEAYSCPPFWNAQLTLSGRFCH